MKTILVPTNFSDSSRNASEYAAQLAKELNYNLLLLHAYNIPVVVPTDVSGSMMIDVSQLEKDSEEQLRKEANLLTAKTGLHVSYKNTIGLAADEIVTAENELQPVLLVMGLSPAGPLDEYLFGSIATDVLRKVKTPLLLVPEKATFKRINRVAFTNDHKMENGLALHPTVKDLLDRFRPAVHVLSIVKSFEESSLEINDKRIEDYFGNVFHSYHVVENADVIDGINEFVDSHQMDLVTMIPHKHNIFVRLFSEGATKRLAFHTRIPLLSIPGQNF